jgi:two-component system, NtrC family, sensor kinase
VSDSIQPERDVLLALNRSASAARLMAGVIHEVNNVLQVISGTVELLQTRPDVPPSMMPALERLSKQTARGAAIFAEAMVFTRASTAGADRVNLREVAEHTLSLRAFFIKRANLTSKLVAPEGMRFHVMGNRGRLQQALMNLIVNAEQASAGTKGEIVVELDEKDGFVFARVVDAGPGMPAQREQLFEAFVSTREPTEGAGLGLWAARTIAVDHGGTVTVEDRPAGAAVVLRLPAAKAS